MTLKLCYLSTQRTKAIGKNSVCKTLAKWNGLQKQQRKKEARSNKTRRDQTNWYLNFHLCTVKFTNIDGSSLLFYIWFIVLRSAMNLLTEDLRRLIFPPEGNCCLKRNNASRSSDSARLKAPCVIVGIHTFSKIFIVLGVPAASTFKTMKSFLV